VSAVVVTGLGYVGLPLALRAVAAGHEVTGYDVDVNRIKRLEAGETYVEDVPAGELAAALESGRFRPSANADACAGFDVALVAVPTPLRDGLPDLACLEAASRTLARYLRPGATVIVESTSYPGTTQEQVLAWLECGSGLAAGPDFHLGYSPERIDPGNRVWTLATTPKIVSGIDGDSLAAVEAFYRGITARTVAVSSPREAELAKLIENTFRHVNIALANELAMFGRDLGVDVWEAIEAASTKPFGFMRFSPGPGVGGPLPAHRPVIPVVEGGADSRPEVQVRRAGQRHQQPHAGLCRPTARARAERARPPHARVPDPAARARLQEEHR
jgi:UDP-N-acetyl-D-glucosamine dehydrogenase